MSEEIAQRERKKERERTRCFIRSAEWRKYARPRFFKPSFHTIGSHEAKRESRYRTERGKKEGKERRIKKKRKKNGNRENETRRQPGLLPGSMKILFRYAFRSVRSFQPILRFLDATTA